jgi:Dehydrogenases with different specificities (related to short-chain alcohol dehydrogenases)
MGQKLSGKTALVTGGTSGIGLQTAKRFVQEGAHVFIVGRRQSELDKAAKELGNQVTALQGDISNLQDLDRVMAQIQSSNKKLDILFANAGGGSFAPLGAITEAQFDKEFGINVKGTVFTVQKALPVLNDGASIILAGSSAASQGMPAFSVYAATKAAIRSLARGWSTDLKDRKIRVNTIVPGLVPTEGYQTELKLSPEQIEQFAAQASQQIPLGRAGTTDEIAKAVLFLASDDSSYVTGIELVVDGGMTQV